MSAYKFCFQGHIAQRDMHNYIAQDNMDVAVDADGVCHLTSHTLIPDDITSDMFSISAWQISNFSKDPIVSPYYKPTLEEMSSVISTHLDSVKSFVKTDMSKKNHNNEPLNNE